MRKLRTYGLLMTIGLSSAPGIAAAGDAGCIWRALPEPVRVAALKSYAVDGGESIFEDVDDKVLDDATLKCVALPSNASAARRTAEAAGKALGGLVLQLGSEAFLKQQLQIEPTALERAYGTIERGRRLELANLSQSSKSPSSALDKVLMSAIQVAYPAGDVEALTDKPVFTQFMIYFLGRAMREQAEAEF